MDERENESVSWKIKQWHSCTQSSKIKKKIILKSDNILRDSWDNTKHYKNPRMRRDKNKLVHSFQRIVWY